MKKKQKSNNNYEVVFLSLETCQKVDSQSKEVMPEAKQACTYLVVESTSYGSHLALAQTVHTKRNIHRKTIGFVFVSLAYRFATRLRISAAEYGPRLADMEVGQVQKFAEDMTKFKI